MTIASPRKKAFGRDNLAGWLFSAPALILLVLFVLIPFVTAFVLSMYNVHIGSIRPPKFMGLEYYRRILFDPITSPIFFRSLINNFLFALIVVPCQTILAVLLAIMLNQKLKGIAFFRTFFFMPVVFPMTLVVVVWKMFFTRDDSGMFNSFLSAITGGLIQPIAWIEDPNLALLSIALMSIWAGVGFQMVIILAGLQEIPAELYEAASIDKAGKVRQFFSITLPSLRNTLVFIVIITTMFALRLFDQVYLLTNGGPLDSTTTVMFQAVTKARTDNIGTGAAETVVFVIIIIAITIVQRLVLRQEKEIK